MTDLEKGEARKYQDEEAPLLSSPGAVLGVTTAGVRLGFIRKVYGIVLAQLLLTSIIASVMMFVEPIKAYVRSSPAMYLLSFAFAITAVLILAFSYVSFCPCYGLYKVYPANYILLVVFVRCFPSPARTCRRDPSRAPTDARRELCRRRSLLLPLTGRRRPRAPNDHRNRHCSHVLRHDRARRPRGRAGRRLPLIFPNRPLPRPRPPPTLRRSTAS